MGKLRQDRTVWSAKTGLAGDGKKGNSSGAFGLKVHFRKHLVTF